MANALYSLTKADFLNKVIDLTNDTIKIALVKSAYTPNMTTDHYYDPAITANVHGTPVTLASKTTTLGTFDAADPTFTAPSAGQTIAYLVIYRDSGVATTSQLIAKIDTATGLSFVTNGADVTVTFDAAGIFTL